MDHQRLQVGIRILLTLDIRPEPRQSLRFTLLLLIRKRVTRKPVTHKLVTHKPGIHKPGIRWRGILIHKLGIRRLVTRRLVIHKLGIRRLVTHKLGILVILDTLLMAMLLGMPSKVPCSPRPCFRPMVGKPRWQVVGILTRVIPLGPFHLLLRATAMAHLVTAHLVMDRRPMAHLGLQVILWVFRRMLRTSWVGTLFLLEPATTKNPAPQH
jgi:hypothetical protein